MNNLNTSQRTTAGSAGSLSSVIWGDGGTEPISVLEILLILLASVLPAVVYVVGFSDMGMGVQVYNQMSPTKISLMGDGVLAASVLLMAALYVVDVFYWKSRLLQTIAFLVPFCMLSAGLCMKSRKYPWAPLVFTLMLNPAFVSVLRGTLAKTTSRSAFYKTLAFCNTLVSIALVAGWSAWMVGGHQWNRGTKDGLAARCDLIYENIFSEFPLNYAAHCHPDTGGTATFGTATALGIKAACAKAASIWFLVWASPLFAAVTYVILSLFCFMHSLTGHQGAPAMIRAIKQFVICLIVLLGGMYCSVSFTSLELGSTLMAFLAAAMTVVVLWTFMEVGSEALVHMVGESHFGRLLAKFWRNDFVRAMGVGATNVFIPVYVALNMLNQKCRKLRGTAMNDGRFTQQAEWLVEELSTWNWAGILCWVAIIAELIFMLQVGVSKATYIFLSWLSELLAQIDFGIVCVLVFVIGNLMFMLPPVPGIPVYVFTGIVIADQGSRKLSDDDTTGFIMGTVIACGIAFLNKLVACTLQYLIGYFMGNSIKIQQLISVDSVPTRAIESIVKRRGLDIGKVMILIGGPDWPTSVGCGIVKANVPQMLLGTLPIIFLCSPCVVAGAFISRQGMGGEDSIYPMLANVSLLVATVAQTMAMFVAGLCILKEIEDKGEELSKHRPEHDAVSELTRKEQHARELYKEITSFKTLGLFDKAVLIVMAAATEFSVFFMVVMGTSCFKPFSVDKDIAAPYEEGGLNGKPWTIVEPIGWAAIGAFGFGVLLHYIHKKVMGSRLKAALKENPPR
uniref:Uncharacterized protein n=1 Tax=Zooxanthella nutricula TaxID=1333877 RepID=A0A7S2QLK1_9DINO